MLSRFLKSVLSREVRVYDATVDASYMVNRPPLAGYGVLEDPHFSPSAMGPIDTWLFDLDVVDSPTRKTATVELGPYCRADLPPGTSVKLVEDVHWLFGVIPIASYSLRKADEPAGPDIGVISAFWQEPAKKPESPSPISD